MARGWRYTNPSLASALLSLCVFRACYNNTSVCAMQPFYFIMGSLRASAFFVVFVLFLVLCSRWSFVDVPHILSCLADHAPDWQPRIFPDMVETRSAIVNTHSHTYTISHSCTK